ncbi:MAG: hypothetical protein ACYC43_03760, partial [Burkholderiales bacterium]
LENNAHRQVRSRWTQQHFLKNKRKADISTWQKSGHSYLALTLNKNGLVDNETNAIKAAIFFDSLVKEHAPFAPCGVWVNRKNDLWDILKGEPGQSRP